MNDLDLRFDDDAPEPDDARVARALDGVRRTVARRRTRRRLVVAVPAIVVVLAAGAALASIARSDGDDERVTTADPADELTFEPDTPWDDAILDLDARTIRITVGSQPPGDGPCHQNFRWDVVEGPHSIVIGVDELEDEASEDGGSVDEARVGVACVAMAQPQEIVVELDEMHGGRPVFDGISRQARHLHRKVDAVEATWLPEGWERTSMEPLTGGDDGTGWFQAFGADDADWYATVTQVWEHEGRTPRTKNQPITINGLPAVLTTGVMNGTVETISWTEGSQHLTVMGEMQGPPTFTQRAELIRLAEGLRLAPYFRGDDATTTTTTEASTTTVPTTTTDTVVAGDLRCRVVERPASGELAVPADDGAERLAVTVTWPNELELSPPPADARPATSPDDLALPLALPGKTIVKLAVLDDPQGRAWMGSDRLVWARFAPQHPSTRSGPSRPGGDGGTTTTEAGDAPCAMSVALTDATTGEDITIVSIG